MILDWLIIGGGIHGVHIAVRLLGEANVARAGLRIVDPCERLLARWRAWTATTGMTHLRSPSTHHLDLSPYSLDRFAEQRAGRRPWTFAPPYDRPALALFNAHCDHVIETFDLAELHIRSQATACSIDRDRVSVHLSGGREVVARKVVLAVGAGQQPEWPHWAPRNDTRVRHMFAPEFDGPPSLRQTVVVVGGGISAGQVALRLVHEGHLVHLVSRHKLRQHQFDSDPGWLGPKFMTNFSRKRDFDRRRAVITQARHRGSVPPDLHRALCRAIACDQLRWHNGTVDSLDARSDALQIRLTSGATLETQSVLLATGFAAHRPGGSLVDQMVTSASLPCARCGYPIVDAALRWHPRVHVSGPLAELELGPAARNIAGARRAGDRLVQFARSHRSPEAQRSNADGTERSRETIPRLG